MTDLLKLSRDVLLTMEKFQVDLYFDPWTKIEVRGIVKCHPLEGHHPRQELHCRNYGVIMCAHVVILSQLILLTLKSIRTGGNLDYQQLGY